MDIINQYNIFNLISSVSLLIIGLFVIRKSKKSKLNFIFFLICIATFLWQFSFFVLFSGFLISFNYFFVKLCYLGITFLPVLFYHFICHFVYAEKQRNTVDYYGLIFSYFISFFFALLLMSDNFISGVNSFYWGRYPQAGVLHPLFMLFLVILAVRVFYILIDYLKNDNSKNFKKYQVRYLLVAIVFYVISSIDFLPNYGISLIYPLGFLFILIFLGIIAYTIATYRFMDIKLVLRQSSVYVASLVAALIPAVILRFLVRSYLPDFSFWVDFVILIITISIFPILRNFFYRFANKYFFTTLYDSKKLIGDLTNALSATIDEKESYEILVDAMNRAFHCKAIGIMGYDPKEDVFVLKYNMGFKLQMEDKIKISKNIFNDYIIKDKVVVVEELKSKEDGDFKQFIEIATKLKIQVLAPMTRENKVVGAIILSEKESRDIYNNEDIETIDIIDSQMAISLENAILYSQTREFNVKLTEEVERATAEVRQANVELKKLDKAKSEFISIASHQLRTPLTVIKGYASMMLDGSFGEISPKVKENLQKVFDSNERLIGLVEDLLNVSRIESGRLKFDFEKCQLEDVVSSVVEELTPNIQAQSLYINFKQPTGLPAMLIDKRKMRQVIINMIDNSIKYTKTGGIDLELTQQGDVLRFCIIDTGMGISPNDLPNLFKKFSRGEDTSIVHTEGTGLGLYVGKQMVEVHGGKIWAESEGIGKGAKFCFELPIKFTPPKEATKIDD